MNHSITRCSWCGTDPLYTDYHDHEWGTPVHDDARLFEFLTLEGAQAGLSWITVLRKREKYRQLFHDWDIEQISQMRDDELEKILLDPGIIRNRLKVYSVRKNARVALQIQKEFGSLDAYFWKNPLWKEGTGKVGDFASRQSIQFPIINHLATLADIETHTPVSDAISRDLKKRGMSFIGSTIIYAFMQATGMVDDHVDGCFAKNLA